jgi:antitoxin component YwqK of YwqJK toxin-antitoxin module
VGMGYIEEMKKILLTILPLLLFVGCSKKPVDEVALIEKEGVKYLSNSIEPFSGEVMIYYPNGEKKYSGLYENGVLVKIKTFNTKDDLVVYDNETASSADFDDASNSEIITEYYNNDRIRLKGFKIEGEYWGDFTEWYENGSIKSEKTYVSGTLSGPYKIWYKNGELKEEWNFENNQKNGPYYRWYKNGKKEIEGFYKNKLKNDLWHYWNKNGEKIKVVPYLDDKINGKYTKYLKGGAIAQYRQYANGVPRGKWGISDKLNSGQLEAILEYTQELIENDELKTAMRLLNSMLEKYNYNDNRIIPKAHLKLADIYNKRINDYDRAIIEYTKIIESYENTKEQPLALYNIIRIYKCKLKSGEMESIKQKEFLDIFPGHELAGKFNNDCKED